LGQQFLKKLFLAGNLLGANQIYDGFVPSFLHAPPELRADYNKKDLTPTGIPRILIQRYA
jgi:hypothetical protein